MAAPFLGFIPPPNPNPFGALLEGGVQGFQQGRENRLFAQDLQNLAVHQQALGQAQFPGVDPALPQLRSSQGQQLQAQNLFQNLGLQSQPITPSEQERFKIQREGIQQRADAATATSGRFRPGESFGPVEVAKEGDGTNLQPGTAFAVDQVTGLPKILQAPKTPLSPTAEIARSTIDALNKLSPEQRNKILLDRFSGQGRNVTNVTVSTGGGKLTTSTQTEAEKAIFNISNNIAKIDSIIENFEPEFLTFAGQTRAGGTKFLERFLKIKPEDTEKFLESVGVVKKADPEFLKRFAAFMRPAFDELNRQIKEITGVAVREGEEGRIFKSTIHAGEDSPTTFLAKANDIKAFQQESLARALIWKERGLDVFKSDGTLDSRKIQNAKKLIRNTPSLNLDLKSPEVQARVRQQTGDRIGAQATQGPETQVSNLPNAQLDIILSIAERELGPGASEQEIFREAQKIMQQQQTGRPVQ